MAILWRHLIITTIVPDAMKRGKGSDPCLTKQSCSLCNVLTMYDQRAQIATPSYKVKKEK